MLHRMYEMLDKGTGHGPTWNMIAVCQKYSLLEQLIESITSGQYLEYRLFKTNVQRIIQDKDLQRWKVTSRMYKSMDMFNFGAITRHNVLGWLCFMHDNIIWSKQ